MTLAQAKNWKKALLNVESSLKGAIENLNESTLQIVLVVDKSKKLVGTITDGDIRRALLRRASLDEPIGNILNKSPFVVSEAISERAAMHLMQLNKVLQIPVLDDSGLLCGLHVWSDATKSDSIRQNTMIVMAGGRGQRLHPFTEDCPKPMLEINGKPILQHIIERGKLSGISNFILATHYLGHKVEDYFRDGRDFGVKITYLKEENPLGTAGALSLMEDLPKFPLIITNGDVLTQVNYGDIIDFHDHNQASATMAVFQHKWENPFGVVKLKGLKVEGFEEKPIIESFINAGIYVLQPAALTRLKKGGHCDMPDFLQRLMNSGEEVNAYPIHESWIDIGRHKDLKSARQL